LSRKLAMEEGKLARKKAKKPGPKEERLAIPEAWQDAVRKAVRKKKPRRGWPKEEDENGRASEEKG
jgi:hypothetical protein